jgi:hypothetical protein
MMPDPGDPGYEESSSRWSSWGNKRSFWLARGDLMAAIRDAGFDLVLEQAGYLADITAPPGDRGMFIGLKS